MTRTRLARHVSYANVMATVAVFIALGGTGYAMSQISGSQIKNHSIPGQKLKPHTLTAGQIKTGSLVGQDLAPHSIAAAELRDLVVSAKGRSTKARMAQAGSSSAPATIITLSVGQSAPVVQSGPFTYSAVCTADSSDQPLVSIQGTSSEPGSLIAPYGPMTPGQPEIIAPPTSDQFDHIINGDRMIAPSGAALIVDISYGTRLFGAGCWVTGFGVT